MYFTLLFLRTSFKIAPKNQRRMRSIKFSKDSDLLLDLNLYQNSCLDRNPCLTKPSLPTKIIANNKEEVKEVLQLIEKSAKSFEENNSSQIHLPQTLKLFDCLKKE